ncbi:putative Symplekin tight junction protein C terminal [Trypanosoma vivax]|nr:putative Symplekin tight junction protein C terminal [Trypanosoma vivax]
MPPSMIDSGLDAVCARLRRELLRLNSAQGGGKFAGPCANALPLTSVYQLVMQILFTLYSAQAPVRERDSKALLFSGAYDTEETELQTRAAFTIDTDNPVGWLQAVQGTYGGFADRKRPRDGQSLDGSLAVDRGAEDTVHSGGSRDISQFFHDDTTLSSCAYSHFLCRVMELLTETGLPALLLDLLLQCPRITRHVWHYMLKHYCLSAEKTRCVLGMGLLKSIALRRAVYRRQALNSLLYISAVWFEYPRRLAVMQLGKLLDAPVEPNGRPVIDSDMEALLVRYAKRQIAAIPVTKLTSTGFDLAARKTKNEPDEEGARDAVMLPRDELLQLTESLDRCLGAFLMLCARQPRELFPALLDVFRECVERQNTTMVQLLAEHVDVRRMCQRLFQSNALSFLSNVMPYLRRCSSSSSMLVQRILWSTSAELRLMGKAGSVSLSDLQRIAAGLLGHAQVMYDSSDIPIVYRHAIHSGAVGGAKSISDGLAGGSSTSLHDVRFIAPFFSLIPAEDLKKTYLRSFLHFVELQLQLQEQRHQHHGIALEENHAVMESIRMSEEETQQFIRDVAREVLTRSPVQMEDGSPRGLSRIDLLVYLHRASGDNQNDETRLNVIQQGAGLSSVNASKAEPQGILNKPNTGPSSVSGGRTGADNLSLPVVPDTVHGVPSETLPLGAENLPLSPLTTRKVIFTLLELRRTFDNSTLEPLYGSEEIKSAVRRMMRDAGGASVPSQLMATLIFACDAHHQRIHSDLVRFVHHEVLLPLAKEATWEKDMQLWRGVLLFAEKYYRECSSFLVSLPDQVLIHALRDQQRLCEYFREEHGNNASFGHILGNL